MKHLTPPPFFLILILGFGVVTSAFTQSFPANIPTFQSNTQQFPIVSGSGCFYDSTFTYRRTNPGNPWLPYRRAALYYDAFNRSTGYQTQQFTNGNWINLALSTITYSGSGQDRTELYQSWDSAGWANSVRYTISYNSDGTLQSTILEFWSNNAWELNNKVDYLYDSFQNIISEIHSNWSGFWYPGYRYTMNYDANQRMQLRLLENYMGSNWEPSEKDTMIYDTAGRIVLKATSIWDSFSLQWEDNRRETTQHDTLNNLSSTILELYNNGWQNEQRSITQRNIFNDIVSYSREDWNGTGWSMASDDYWDYCIPGCQRWNRGSIFTNGTITYQDSTWQNCILISSAPELTKQAMELKIHPNPSTGMIHISSTKPYGPCELSISSMAGQLIYIGTLDLNRDQELDISYLKSGIYLINVRMKDEAFQKRLIKID